MAPPVPRSTSGPNGSQRAHRNRKFARGTSNDRPRVSPAWPTSRSERATVGVFHNLNAHERGPRRVSGPPRRKFGDKKNRSECPDLSVTEPPWLWCVCVCVCVCVFVMMMNYSFPGTVPVASPASACVCVSVCVCVCVCLCVCVRTRLQPQTCVFIN